MRLVLASRNPHKLSELSALLAGHELISLPAGIALPPETGATFVANARAKARAAVLSTALPALADDSGIEAMALGGAPGVRSARFAGARASDEDNLSKLMRAVAPHEDRGVAYVCVLAFATPEGEEASFEGRCEGALALAPRGDAGFGYDPVFLPREIGDGHTMAELSPREKNRISHRARAARAFAEWIERQERHG